jgi:hypothetical protein
VRGKDGIIYVVNRSNMGHYSATTDHAVQKLAIGHPEPINGNWFTPANWNGYVYFGEMNESVMAFNFANGLLPSSPSSQTTKVFGYPGASATFRPTVLRPRSSGYWITRGSLAVI